MNCDFVGVSIVWVLFRVGSGGRGDIYKKK